MPSKYWEDSADLSRDSTIDSIQEHERSPEADSEPTDVTSTSQSSHAGHDGTVSRVMSTSFNLPALEPHEHANLFYLSLIEGRCRTQAAASINAGRDPNDLVGEDHPEVTAMAQHLFTEMSKELVKAGMIPQSYVARPLAELRLYLRSFDSVLNGIAAEPRDITNHDGQRVIEYEDHGFPRFQTTSTSGSLAPRRHVPVNEISFTDPFERSFDRRINSKQPSINDPRSYDASQTDVFDHSSITGSQSSFGQPFSQALVRRSGPLASLELANLNLNANYMANSFVPPGQDSLATSKFTSEYCTTAILGKGGFGKVVKATSRVDRAEYAIKRIKTPAAKMQQLAQSGRIEDLLKEVQALARYNHPHIVRYFHAWVEMQPASVLADGTWSDEEVAEEEDEEEAETHTTPQQPLSRTDSVVVDMGNLALENEQALEDEFRQQQNTTTTHQLNSDQVIFEVDRSASPVPQRSFFRSAADSDSSDSDDEGNGATVSDGTTSTISLSRHPSNDRTLITQVGNHNRQPLMDCLIYIKMTSYPLTLADFIFPSVEPPLSSALSTLLPRHCFHPLPALRILLRLVYGLAYLHRKNEIHRDLKPANVFLSILDDGDQPNEAWVDINDCPECIAAHGVRPPCYISPCIGDFGLVVDLKDLKSRSVAESSTAFGESSHNHVPGTKLYIPPTQLQHNIICPKLDVYALGVITFELLYKFDTKSERLCVLSDAREGKWPGDWKRRCSEMDNGLDDNSRLEMMKILAEGIEGMMEPDIKKRWTCEDVRLWATGLESRCRDQQALKA